MGLDELLGSLMTHVINMKSNEENEKSSKKKGIVVKVSSSKVEVEIKEIIVTKKLPFSQKGSTRSSKETNF